MRLTGVVIADLKWLADQRDLVWGGVYETGGDPMVNEMERAGLIERVSRPYWIGRLTFAGGYRITPAGRNALATSKGGER